MVRIEFLGPINKPDMDLDIKNLKQLKEILNKDEDLKQWLDICSVAINDKLVSSLDTPLNPNDKISLLPPVCGG